MRVLVGFDGSDGGRDALELTRVLASATGADVLVVTVIPYGQLPVPPALFKRNSPEAEPFLAEARQRLAGLGVETRAFGGGTPGGVCTVVAEDGVIIDLLVVGSPHRGLIGRALIGSVADSLLPRRPLAVVVAPRGYASESHDPLRLIAVAYDGTPEARAALHRAEAIAPAVGARIRVLTVVAPPVAVGVAGYVPPSHPTRRRSSKRRCALSTRN